MEANALRSFSTRRWVNLIKEHGYRSARLQRALGVSWETIKRHLILHGLALFPRLRYHTDAELVRMARMHRTIRLTAIALGVSSPALKAVFADRGLEAPWDRGRDTRRLREVSTEVLEKMYTHYQSAECVGEVLGVYPGTVRKELRRRGLPVNPRGRNTRITKPSTRPTPQTEDAWDVDPHVSWRHHEWT